MSVWPQILSLVQHCETEMGAAQYLLVVHPHKECQHYHQEVILFRPGGVLVQHERFYAQKGFRRSCSSSGLEKAESEMFYYT